MTTTEVFNDFGRRNGYPIYVFNDGTLGSYRQAGKTVLYTVEGPIDCSYGQRQIASGAREVIRQPETRNVAKPNIFRRMANAFDNKFGRTVEDACYEEIPNRAVRQERENCRGMSYDNDNSGQPGFYRHAGSDWSVEAHGARNVKAYQAERTNPDGSVEKVYVANISF